MDFKQNQYNIPVFDILCFCLIFFWFVFVSLNLNFILLLNLKTFKHGALLDGKKLNFCFKISKDMSKSIYVNARHFFIGTTGFIVQAITSLDIYALKNELNGMHAI